MDNYDIIRTIYSIANIDVIVCMACINTYYHNIFKEYIATKTVYLHNLISNEEMLALINKYGYKIKIYRRDLSTLDSRVLREICDDSMQYMSHKLINPHNDISFDSLTTLTIANNVNLKLYPNMKTVWVYGNEIARQIIYTPSIIKVAFIKCSYIPEIEYLTNLEEILILEGRNDTLRNRHFCLLPKLRYLYINATKLYEHNIPNGLEFLDISECNSSPLPHISTLSNLTKLHVSAINVRFIDTLTKLRTLMIKANETDSYITLRTIKILPYITKLHVSGSHITPDDFRCMANVRSLYCSYMATLDNNIPQFCNITSLSFDVCVIRNFEYISSCTSLRNLKISRSNVSGGSLENINDIAIVSLEIRGCVISTGQYKIPDSLTHISIDGNNTKLIEQIRHNYNITHVTLHNIKKELMYDGLLQVYLCNTYKTVILNRYWISNNIMDVLSEKLILRYCKANWKSMIYTLDSDNKIEILKQMNLGKPMHFKTII